MCGHTNRGDALSCTACFAARPEGVIFYLPRNAEEITSARDLEAAGAGPDWRCAQCTYDNPADHVHCQHCGALRDASEEREYGIGGDRESSEWKNRQAFETRIYNPAPTNPDYDAQQPADKPAMASSGSQRAVPSKRPVLWGIAAVVVGMVALMIYLATRHSPVELEVAGIQWHRAIEIYQPQTRIASGWSVPAGATLVAKETRQNGWTHVPDGFEIVTKMSEQRVQDGTETVSEQVHVQTSTKQEKYACGTRDLGNGRFETKICTRDVPVYGTTTVTKQVPKYTTVQIPVHERVQKYREVPRYDDWYSYSITECMRVNTLAEHGTDHNPRWPHVALSLSAACPSQRSEKYSVVFRDVSEAGHKTTYTKDVDLREFTTYRVGNRFRGNVHAFGGLSDVTPLK
jgi:hypothetical protein